MPIAQIELSVNDLYVQFMTDVIIANLPYEIEQISEDFKLVRVEVGEVMRSDGIPWGDMYPNGFLSQIHVNGNVYQAVGEGRNWRVDGCVSNTAASMGV